MRTWLSFLCLLLTSIGFANAANLAPREPCNSHVPERQAFFGDLHVHTSLSMDAYIFDTRTDPDTAYRFAKGESIRIAPLDENGNPSFEVSIDRPLDFAAVTDHAENFGGVSLCTNPNSEVFSSESCSVFRNGTIDASKATLAELTQQVVTRSQAVDQNDVCGADGKRCRLADQGPWRMTQEAAEQHYDRSADCAFTTFVAYEYSFSPEYSKVHRNIIFRNEKVVDRPIHSLLVSDPVSMLRLLRDRCQDMDDGCDVLSIPHNPNYSDGRLFKLDSDYALSKKHKADEALLRQTMEPIVEMFQVKGDSECSGGLPGVRGGEDEFCGFEKMRQMFNAELAHCGNDIGSGALMGRGCLARNGFVRNALVDGIAEQKKIGVNPFKFGFIGSTDAHDGTMGNTAETSQNNPGRVHMQPNSNPGGLMGVWAEENSRDSIFDSMQRREVFGTSGSRIVPRFFAGWNMDESLCNDVAMIEKLYDVAVPMGSQLPQRPADGVPSFVIAALADPQSEKLERLQIIKAWPGEDGTVEQRVFNVAGGAMPGAHVHEGSCATSNAGQPSLCGVWKDPEFDPEEGAVYYSRAIEMPSCRWSQHYCLAFPTKERPAWCEDPRVPKTVQERAWSSPIWYQPLG